MRRKLNESASLTDEQVKEVLSYVMKNGISDRRLYQLLRWVIFDCNTINNWQKFSTVIFEYMPELQANSYESYEDLIDFLKNGVRESKSRKSSRKLSIRESAQQNVTQDLAERVAQAMQDMDWRDWLSDSYDTYEEEWGAFVDYVWDELYSEPASVVQTLHEIGADEELINEVAKNCSEWFGIYARDYSNGIPVILKFNTLEEAEEARGMLPDIHALDSDSDFVGAGDYTSTVLDDYNCEGYIEVSRRDIDRNLVGNAFTYDYDLYYIVNGVDWFDIL